MKKDKEKNVENYIMEALFHLMKKKKYEKISIIEITKKAGVGRSSFYRNFNSKEEILTKWIDKITDSFLEKSHINYKKDSSKDYFIKLFTHLNQYREQSILIYQAGLDYLLKKKFDTVFKTQYLKEYDSYKIYFISGGIYNIYYYWLANGCIESPEEITNRLLDLIVKL